jgi:hypothetical protein
LNHTLHRGLHRGLVDASRSKQSCFISFRYDQGYHDPIRLSNSHKRSKISSQVRFYLFLSPILTVDKGTSMSFARRTVFVLQSKWHRLLATVLNLIHHSRRRRMAAQRFVAFQPEDNTDLSFPGPLLARAKPPVSNRTPIPLQVSPRTLCAHPVPVPHLLRHERSQRLPAANLQLR